MAMAWIFTAMIVISVVFGMVNGTMDAVSAAALSGANDAITLTISLLGVLCLWSGVLEVMDQSGLSNKLAAIFRPLLRKIFPDASADPVTLSAISANISANLLGIGNAATPLGIQAYGAWLQRHRVRQFVPLYRAQYRFHPTDPRHSRRRARSLRSGGTV